MRFRDRRQAGRLLAPKLEPYRTERPVVLGLTRGGVPVAAPVARYLEAPLEAMVVRKLGAPQFPEYAIGAIAEEGATFVDPDAVRSVGLGDEDVAALAEREAAELTRRVRLYRAGRTHVDLHGRTAVLVDDGVATGATARAAARSARLLGAPRVILAAPVIAAASVPALEQDVDAIVALQFPEDFFAVGEWYEDFGAVSDDEVVAELERAEQTSPDEERAAELWDGEWLEAQEEQADPPPSPGGEETLAIPIDGERTLEATLVRPPEARGLVVFVHGSGSSRASPRNRFVARALQQAGLATVLFDLLTPEEAAEDELTGALRFDVELLADRVIAAVRWLVAQPRTRALRVGCFGSSTGAAAALIAAAELPDDVHAVVSRGGRPDLVEPRTLGRVRAPVLLVVGSRDTDVLELNRSTLRDLANARLVLVPGATHLFEEPGTLQAVVRLAADWFRRHLAVEQGLPGGRALEPA